MKKTYLKDSVFGYIEIEKEISKVFLNSKMFQRLRGIEQSNLGVLYPGAVTTRFSHSIGVYHLSQIAIDSLILNFSSFDTNSEKLSQRLKNMKPSFEIAALLHDVGHAPLSHMTEEYFRGDLQEFEDTYLYKIEINLFECIKKNISATKYKRFKTDYLNHRYQDNTIDKLDPKPHEIMSCNVIMSNEKYLSYFEEENIDLNLIIRSILGCTYELSYENKTPKTIFDETEKSIRNGVIKLLNSDTIDVDKLDYLLRDSYYSGFENSSIDYNRLLGSVLLFMNKKNNNFYSLAFDKRALSVIDGVHSSLKNQQMWLFNHPSIIYDNYLKSNIIKTLSNILLIDDNDAKIHISELFSLKSIIGENRLKNGCVVDTFSDYDIQYLIKKHKADIESITNSNIVDQLFERNKRLKPAWKNFSVVDTYMQKGELDFDLDLFIDDYTAFHDIYDSNNFSLEFEDEIELKDSVYEFVKFIDYLVEELGVSRNDILMLPANNVFKREDTFFQKDLYIYYPFTDGSVLKSFHEVMNRRKIKSDSEINKICSNHFFVFYNSENPILGDFDIVEFFSIVSSYERYSSSS